MWGSLTLTLVKIVSAFIAYAQQKQLITAGEAIARLSILTSQHDTLVKANASREKVRSDIAHDPSSVMRDDGFKRKD